MSELCAVILAAGFSSRMSGFKPLLELGDMSALARCVALFRGAGINDVVVVTGFRREEVEAAAGREGARSVFNADHASGMFSSVRAGVAALSKHCAGFFLLPVDIPLVRPQTVRSLAQEFVAGQEEVLIPHFLGQPGHPPLIPASFRQAIARSRGDAGGLRSLLEQGVVRTVPVPDQGVLLDMDTDQDLERLEQRLARIGLPGKEECDALLDYNDTPENVRAHGRAVARAALNIAKALNAVRRTESPALDLERVERAALLHDLAKGHPRHEAYGGELLRAWEFSAVADIVAAHRDTTLPETQAIGEREVVFMADKLIQGVRAVPLTSRYDAVLERHGHDPEARVAIEGRRRRALALLRRMEAEIGVELSRLIA